MRATVCDKLSPFLRGSVGLQGDEALGTRDGAAVEHVNFQVRTLLQGEAGGNPG